ncbi:MAG: P-II family nitrogen regulator [Planctomycetes bacterium]|nr:P-II family nitrogen regulator [Planctomycetota bacterium]
MKFVVGIVPGEALEAVTEALAREAIYRLTISEVEFIDTTTAGSGSPIRSDRSEESCALRLEIAVNDEFLEPALRAFREVERAFGQSEPESRSGTFWVSVLPLQDVIRIRTGETGTAAI